MNWPSLNTLLISITTWLSSMTGNHPTAAALLPPIPAQPEVLAAMITPEVSIVPVTTAPLPPISARSFWIEDLSRTNVMSEQAAYQPLPPASTTKIMTALITLDHWSLDEIVEVPDFTVEGAKMELVAGEQLRVRDLLYGLLLHSGNDAAVVLANHFPGGQDSFIEAMNQKARQLGLEQTNYVNPTGLHHPLHLSSTRDLVKLTKAALQYPDFVQIVGTYEITVKSLDNLYQHHLINRNQLLKDVFGVKGVKTGWTEEAGEALVTWIERDNREILIAVLGSQDRFADTTALIDWAYYQQ